MTVQSEYQLENDLINQLVQLGIERVNIHNEAQLFTNLKSQIERANGIPPLSENEWKQVWSYLNNGTIFERAKNLRNKCPVSFDNGTSRHIEFLFSDHRKNHFQISNQITIDPQNGSQRTYRFDVTILVNGLPLVQIELKKRGMEIAEAFHQVHRYSREAYSAGLGLFQFIQLFVISNGVNTRYYANGTNNIAFIFPWTDFSNTPINEIVDFAEVFLNPQHLTDMLSQYMVLLETTQQLMVLRPYQIYAVQKIVERVQSSSENGYIWHTTGSGKTLTSFKASQIIMQMPEVEKVLFVVDRNDLDTQTAKEFNHFKTDSVDSTTNTKTLVNQLDQQHDKLIVTTLQKLNRAISTDKYSEHINYLRDKKVVFIFDECHRSQFGETHRNIKKFFHNAQMFGFTGTPIFDDNSQSQAGLKLTTDYLFNERLHQYVIVDAIRDKNVLQFQIDYRGKYTAKGMQQSLDGVDGQADDVGQADEVEKVEGIDIKELYDNPKRLEMIARYIVDHHDTKTKQRDFTAMFCVSSVDTLTQYYELFEQVQAEKQQHDEAQGKLFKPLTIATIFSYAANQDVEPTADNSTQYQSGMLDEENTDIPTQINVSNRDKLDRYIAQYNAKFQTNYNSGDQFYPYYRDIADRVKKKEIDILLVVNMFLTGFDSKPLNTLYVDKNLKYHGLIQAFSRTNRVFNENKPFGNIVCFRNLKRATDEALALFSNKQAKSIVLIRPFAEIKQNYEKAVNALKEITPTEQTVDLLQTEDEQLEFIKAFREVMRSHAQLQTFVEYDQDQTGLDKQKYANFASKYSDLCREVKTTTKKDKVSVLDDVDFQLELLHSDRINVGYIIQLLQMAVDSKDVQLRKQYEAQVLDLIGSEVSLHDKQELIQKFIDETMPRLINGEKVEDAFAKFWDVEKEKSYQALCKKENLNVAVFEKMINDYQYTKRIPRKDELTKLPNYKMKLSQRSSILDQLVAQTRAFIEKFYMGW